MRFFVESGGQYSGGGQAVLNNCVFAARQHEILAGSSEAGDVPFIMRNVPARDTSVPSRYVLGPQNALPWTRHARGVTEWLLVGRLRMASEWYSRRALALFRTSSMIPPMKRERLTSPVLHNVLDRGFEEALVASAEVSHEPSVGHIVSIGSGYSYRNLRGLLSGYARYREIGGTLPLFIGGSPASGAVRREVEQTASGLPDVRIWWGAIPRPQFLAALRDAPAVVLPSLVEASPLSVLEACALTPRVVMSDIVGHREILAPFGSRPPAAFFDVTSSRSMAAALCSAEDGGAATELHKTLRNHERRDRAREEWASALAGWFETIAGVA